MEEKKERSRSAVVIIRRIARIWDAIVIVLMLPITIAEVVLPHVDEQVQTSEWVMLAFLPFGAVVGLILAWWWEGVGGGITVVSSLISLVIFLVVRDEFRPGFLIPLLAFAIPGILFLVYWFMSRLSLAEEAPA